MSAALSSISLYLLALCCKTVSCGLRGGHSGSCYVFGVASCSAGTLLPFLTILFTIIICTTNTFLSGDTPLCTAGTIYQMHHGGPCHVSHSLSGDFIHRPVELSVNRSPSSNTSLSRTSATPIFFALYPVILLTMCSSRMAPIYIVVFSSRIV